MFSANICTLNVVFHPASLVEHTGPCLQGLVCYTTKRRASIIDFNSMLKSVIDVKMLICCGGGCHNRKCILISLSGVLKNSRKGNE